MTFTNSPLATYTAISKHHGGQRGHKIDTITIHIVVGQWPAKQIADYFHTLDKNASCNYGVGKDGSIALCVEEKDRSFCSSSYENDDRAVTIECASDLFHPYRVTDAMFEALIKLCADICKRNGMEKLVWSTNKNERVNHLNGCNMTVHRDYANKPCPGDYLYNRMGEIAQRVNEILEEENMVRYQKVEDMPKWAQPEIQELVDANALRGDDDGNLNLTEDMIRMLIINKRYTESMSCCKK